MNNRTDLDPFDRLGLVILNIGVGVVAAVRWAILFPIISIPIAFTVAVNLIFGPRPGILVAAGFAAGLLLWKKRYPAAFDRLITGPARNRFLIWWRYRRQWERLLDACKLTATAGNRVLTPKFLTADIGKATDQVRLRMLHGQAPADYENRVDALAHAFRAEQCHAVITGPAIVELRFRRSDSLTDTVVLPRVDHWTKPRSTS